MTDPEIMERRRVSVENYRRRHKEEFEAGLRAEALRMALALSRTKPAALGDIIPVANRIMEWYQTGETPANFRPPAGY